MKDKGWVKKEKGSLPGVKMNTSKGGCVGRDNELHPLRWYIDLVIVRRRKQCVGMKLQSFCLLQTLLCAGHLEVEPFPWDLNSSLAMERGSGSDGGITDPICFDEQGPARFYTRLTFYP